MAGSPVAHGAREPPTSGRNHCRPLDAGTPKEVSFHCSVSGETTPKNTFLPSAAGWGQRGERCPRDGWSHGAPGWEAKGQLLPSGARVEVARPGAKQQIRGLIG